jgi:DNA-directed RNA polymerase specialized sigma24 family protein
VAIAQGDLEAVGKAFDRHGQDLFDYCQSQLDDVADAAQVVEATFVIAAAKASLLQKPARLRAWLFAIARCGCQQRLEAGANPAYLDEMADYWDWDRLGGSAWHSDLLSTAWAALAQMNPRDREVAQLSLRHGLDAAELSDVLGVPRSQARALVQSSCDQFEASADLLLASCSGRSWYCETAAAYLNSLNSDLTRISPRWMRRHAPSCGICAKWGRLSAVITARLPTAALPADERQRLLRLLSESSADVEGYRAEVILRLGPFDADGYPRRRSGPPAGRWRGSHLIGAGAAVLTLALLGAGAALVADHFATQGGLQTAVGTHSPSPSSGQSGKTEASGRIPSSRKGSSSARSSPKAKKNPSPRPSLPSPGTGSPLPGTGSHSPKPKPSHSSPPPSPAPPTPTAPASPVPTPTPTPELSMALADRDQPASLRAAAFAAS